MIRDLSTSSVVINKAGIGPEFPVEEDLAGIVDSKSLQGFTGLRDWGIDTVGIHETGESANRRSLVAGNLAGVVDAFK